MKFLILVAWFVCSVATAKIVVTESPLPATWPDVPVKVEATVSAKHEWIPKTNAKEFVDMVLAGNHSAQKKIDVLTWWSGHVERPDFLVDLASRCAVLGQNDHAFYWLQRAAMEDACDPADIEGEEEFAKLVKDPRWPKVKEFLLACEAQWKKSAFYRDVLTLPKDYDGKTPIPLVIGLHGFGSLPEDFSGADFQRISDAQGVAFLSVSGRMPLGRNSFMWTESFEKDLQHIERAMVRCGPSLQVAPGRTVAIGFSQGGQLAAEITAAQPNKYRGCLSMSPGSRYSSGLAARLEAAQTSLSGQRYFFTWISGEGTGPKTRAQSWRAALEKRNAIVHEYEFPGKGHNFPRNYEDYFAIAIQVLVSP